MMIQNERRNTPAHVLVKTYDELHKLLQAYGAASSIQWERPRRGSSEAGGRQKGTHSDPTPDTVLDGVRWEVRKSVQNVDRRVQRLHDEIVGLRRALEDAVDKWGE